MANSELLFHETFQPELKYVSLLLNLGVDCFRGDKYRISELTGIPTGKEKGKVEPHIRYSKYMGLINYTVDRGVYNMSLTPMGKEVIKQDKYLHEPLTLWLMHYFITRRYEGAPQWSFLVHHVHKGFSNLVSYDYAISLLQKEFDLSAVEATKSFSVVKNSYVTGCFANLHYLNWNEKIGFEEQREHIEYGYLYAYALIDSWDKLLHDKKEITLPELLDELSFGKVFGLNDDDLDSVLNTLEERRIISVNRQLYPITIIRTCEISEVIECVYSLLM